MVVDVDHGGALDRSCRRLLVVAGDEQRRELGEVDARRHEAAAERAVIVRSPNMSVAVLLRPWATASSLLIPRFTPSRTRLRMNTW